MGSDSPPELLFAAVAQVASELDASHTLVVFCTPEARAHCESSFKDRWPSQNQAQIAFVEGDQVIEMDDSPLQAVRHKRQSSMILGIEAIKNSEIDAFLSTGNTGALVASATLSLKRLPGVDRPALLATLPTEKGPVAVLDVGGNVSCRPQHVVQFAHLGAAFQTAASGIEKPKVGLLNIGLEAQKGTSHIQRIYQTLTEHCSGDDADTRGMVFAGNVEGRDVYRGAVDVLVTDGFTGNVFLKASEGVSSFILDHLESAFSDSPDQMAMDVLANLQRHVDYAEYPGALVCGIDGVVIKCHGYSNQRAVANGIRGMVRLAGSELISLMREQIQTHCMN